MKHRYSINFFPRLKHSGITLAALTLFIVGLAATASANNITITGNTNWSAINSGSGTSGQPGTSDAITVSNGANLYINASGVCGSITLGGVDGTTGSLQLAGPQRLSVSGAITVGSGVSGGNGTIAYGTGSPELTCNNLVLSSTSNATIQFNTGTLIINGAITVGTGGTYTWTPGSGTVVIGATSTLPSTVFSQFYNLTINPGTGNTVTLGIAITVTHNLAVSSGTLACSTFNITGNASYTFTMAASTSLTLGLTSTATGTAYPSTFTTANTTLDPTSTVVYQANAAQTVSNIPAYGNLTLTSGAASTAKTASGALTVNGNFTLLAAPVQFNAGTSLNHTIKGNWSNSSTHATPFTYTTASTIMLSGSTAQTIGGTVVTSFNNLTISNTNASVSAGANIAVNGTLTVNSSTTLDMMTYTLSVGTQSNSGTINTQSTSGTPISSGKTWGGIVNFNGSSGQIVPAGTYATLEINNANTSGVTLGAAVTITSLTIGNNTSNSVFRDGGQTISTATNLTITSGTYYCSTSTFPWATSSIGGTVSYSTSGTQTIANKTYTNLYISGGFSNGPLTKTLATGATTTVSGTLTITSYTTLAFSTTPQTLALTGTGTLANAGTIDMSTGPNAAHVLQIAATSGSNFGTLTTGTGSTVEYTATDGGNYIFGSSSSVTYNNLTLDNTSGTNTTGGNLTVNGTLTTTAGGVLNMGTNLLSVTAASSAGTISTQNTTTLPISTGKTWGGTINFNGSSTQTIPVGTYASLQINNSAGVGLGGNINVTGTLTMTSGNLTTTNSYSVGCGASGAVSGEGSGHTVIGELIIDEDIGGGAPSARLNNFGVSISSGSDNLGTVEVIRTSGYAGQVSIGTSESIYKNWSISSSNSSTPGRNLTLTWISDDVPSGYSLSSAQGWNSTDGGTSWLAVGTSGDLSSGSVTVPFTSSSSAMKWTICNNSPAQKNVLLFNGAQYVVTPASSILNTSSVTVEAWIKPGTTSQVAEILRLKSSSTDDGCELQLNTDGSLMFIGKFQNIAWTGAAISSGVNVLDGNWHHVAGTISGSTTSLYVDGVQVATNNADGVWGSFNFASDVQMYLGAHPGPTNYYTGRISEVRIWNVVRTQTQIQSTINTTLAGTESGLIGYWKLESGTSTTAFDPVGGNNGTLQGFTFSGDGWVTSTVPLGVGTSSNSANFTSGTTNLGTVSLTTTEAFDNSVQITATEIDASPNTLPGSSGTLLSDRYWVITPYGTPGTFSTNLTFTVPSSFAAAAAGTYTLYHRNDNSDGSWTAVVTGAANVTATTIEFDGITSFSQFMIGSSESGLPVELNTFTASKSDNTVQLNWTTATEVKNYGFEIERASTLLAAKWEKIGFVQGHGNSNSPKEYSFTDKPLGGSEFKYRLKQIDFDGTYEYSKEVEIDLGMPTKFSLEQNYPNPFNPSTVIRYTLPFESNVKLIVYNFIGEVVKELVNETVSSGYHEVRFEAGKLSSGIYFYILHTTSLDGKQNYQSVKKMLVLK